MEEKTRDPKQEVLELCKQDRQFAEQLYSELYIFLNYNEELVPMDTQTCEIQAAEKPTWTQNFLYRIRQALKMKGIEVEFDASEVVSLIKQSSSIYGYQLA